MKNIWLLILLFLVVSCDIFETRDPESPNTGRTDFITPTTPELLFNNMKSSLQEKVVENYMQCLVDPALSEDQFIFVPTASSMQNYPTLNNWERESERQYFNNLKTSVDDGSGILLELFNEFQNIQGNSATFQYDYRIVISSVDQAIPGEYRGTAIFTILLDNRNYWVIKSWEDIGIESYSSWSDLKGRFY